MAKPIIAKTEYCLILTVDPAEFDPAESYTVEEEVDGTLMRWTGIRPQREEDGSVRLYLPINRQ